jgi:Flp pilus assembly pilin Flp
MLRELLKNKRAQNTAEYALLIALVIAGVVAMQTYAQRTLQARMKDASAYMTSNSMNGDTASTGLGQYEPYYVNSSYSVNSDRSSTKALGTDTTAYSSTSSRNKTGGETTMGTDGAN